MKTAEEKLIDKFMNVRWDITLENSKEFVDIAEDFAIGLTDWIVEQTSKDGLWVKYDTEHKKYIIKELLEIYKKEK